MRWPFSVLTKTDRRKTTHLGGNQFVTEFYIDGVKVMGAIGDLDNEGYNVINLTFYADNGKPTRHERIVRQVK